MIPIDHAINLRTYESLTLEIFERQVRIALDRDRDLLDEIKLLYEARKAFSPTQSTVSDFANKLFRIIMNTIPTGIDCTVILHRMGGDNFISYLTSAEPNEAVIVLDEMAQQLRNKI